jgi:hypothetical protein
MEFSKKVNEPKMGLNVESFGNETLGFPHAIHLVLMMIIIIIICVDYFVGIRAMNKTSFIL